MGLLDKLKGVRKPDEGTAAVDKGELTRRLSELNNDQVPFSVAAGDGDGDLVAEWKIVDASWYEVFAKAGLEKSHRILLGLDEDSHEVRALEQSWEVSWKAGVPSLSLSAEKFQGRTLGSKQFGKGYAFRGVNPLDFGEVYEYRFDVSEMKDPIADTVIAAGWAFVPVTSKRKLTG